MPSEINIEDLLEDLDLELSNRGLRERIIACGGFVLRRRYYQQDDRKTDDLDSMTALEDSLRLAAMEVGRRRLQGLGPDATFNWINDRVRETLNLHEKLPPDWEERSYREVPIWEGTKGSLIVYPLPHFEMILTKLNALLGDLTGGSRTLTSKAEQDLRDLKILGYNTEMVADLATSFRKMMPWGKRLRTSRSKILRRLQILLEK